jgi:glycosyltransferase involved in cell wall biosynthesis
MAVRHWPDILSRALTSITAHTNAQVIIVDDATPDPEIAEEFDKIAARFNFSCFHNNIQMQHGLSLDRALSLAPKDISWAITIDSDIVINSRRAFDILLKQTTPDLGAAGRMSNNKVTALFGPFIHSSFAIWNAHAIRTYHLTFSAFQIVGSVPFDLCTGQYLTYRLRDCGKGSGEAPHKHHPYRIVPVHLGDTISHLQVWPKRGYTWSEKVNQT